MSNDDTRKEIGFLLTDIERFERELGLLHLTIINEPDEPIEIVRDTDAREAWEIIERIEGKLDATPVPPNQTFADLCRAADRKQARASVDSKTTRARSLLSDEISFGRAYSIITRGRPNDDPQA
jgi:hypothetical protein